MFRNYLKLRSLFYFFLSLFMVGIFGGFISFTGKNESKANLELIQRIGRASSIISRYYYDPQRIKPEEMLKEGLNALSNRISEMLVKFPKEMKNQMVVSLAEHEKVISFQSPQKLSDILQPAAEVFSFIKDNYKGDVEAADQEYSFISGMLKTLDPHSNMLSPEVFKEFKTQTEGEYGGIGIVVGIKEDELTVIAPLEGPAMKKGLKADDKILEIDHIPTINMPLSEAVEMLRGKVNTTVILSMERKNKEPWEVAITREKIVIQSVRSKIVTSNKKRIGVLSVRSFQEDTYTDLEKALKKMTSNGSFVDGIVIDLRNNPGGLLDQSLDMADKFLEKGDILYTVGADNSNEEVTRARSGDDVVSVPMIALVNQGSASASEIVAGALKNNNRALVMGAQTFGKGSVQSLFNLKDGASVKLTIAQYLTPGRVSIQAVGITPDIQLVPTLISEDRFDLWDDEPYGEAKLEEHLENVRYTKNSTSAYQLRYLQKEKPEEESEYTTKIDEKNDYSLKLAINILAHTKSVDRRLLLPEAIPILKKETEEEDKAVTKALKKHGIDWSPPGKKTEAALAIDFSSTFTDKKSNQPVSQFRGGEEIVWTLTAVNKGKGDISRLLGVLHSENSLFDQREFVFGKVSAGTSGKAEVTVNVPDDVVSFSENLKIKFYAADKVEIPPMKMVVTVAEKSKPILAYRYQIKDDGTDGSRGDGDKKPEKGEIIALEVWLKNQSPNLAGEMIVNLRNAEKEGVLLREGRTLPGKISGFSEVKTKLLFEIQPDYPKEEIELELHAFDKKTRGSILDTLRFSLKEGALVPPDPLPNTFQSAPVISILHKDLQVEAERFHLSGTVEDDLAVGDLVIFAGGKKVFYKAHPSGAQPKKMSFATSFPLEEGVNVIAIQARDNRKFAGQKILSVMGKEKGDLARKSAKGDLSP